MVQIMSAPFAKKIWSPNGLGYGVPEHEQKTENKIQGKLIDLTHFPR